MSDRPEGGSADVRRKLAAEAGKAMLDDAAQQAKQRLEGASTTTKLKIVAVVVGVTVVGFAILGLIANLWKYALLAAVLGGLGVAGYVVVKPRVSALRARAQERLLAGQRQREEEARAKAAADAEAARKKKLEDELAALKRKADR